MDVRGILADRLGEKRVDQADDGRIVGALEQILRLLELADQAAQIKIGVEAVNARHGLGGTGLVQLAQAAVEGLVVEHFQAAGASEPAAHLGEPPRIETPARNDRRQCLCRIRHRQAETTREPVGEPGLRSTGQHRAVGYGIR